MYICGIDAREVEYRLMPPKVRGGSTYLEPWRCRDESCVFHDPANHTEHWALKV